MPKCGWSLFQGMIQLAGSALNHSNRPLASGQDPVSRGWGKEGQGWLNHLLSRLQGHAASWTFLTSPLHSTTMPYVPGRYHYCRSHVTMPYCDSDLTQPAPAPALLDHQGATWGGARVHRAAVAMVVWSPPQQGYSNNWVLICIWVVYGGLAWRSEVHHVGSENVRPVARCLVS